MGICTRCFHVPCICHGGPVEEAALVKAASWMEPSELDKRSPAFREAYRRICKTYGHPNLMDRTDGSDEEKCTCGNGFSMYCPVHGQG